MITSSAPRASLLIYHFISSAPSLDNCYIFQLTFLPPLLAASMCFWKLRQAIVTNKETRSSCQQMPSRYLYERNNFAPCNETVRVN